MGGCLIALKVAWVIILQTAATAPRIKQLKNEGVRVLARGGHYDLARQGLAMNFPLHHQDWECPNRQGTLLAIDARLAALDRDKHAAENLKKARSITDAFLAKVAEADSQTRP